LLRRDHVTTAAQRHGMEMERSYQPRWRLEEERTRRRRVLIELDKKAVDRIRILKRRFCRIFRSALANGQSYEVRDEWCSGRSCLRLGLYRRVVRTCKGFEELAHGQLCCVRREQQGCPACAARV
jgi:hypothetical protein